MEESIIIAKVICVIYLSIGIGLFFNPSYYENAFKKILSDTTYLLLGGWIATALGVVLVQVHNIWTNDWRLLITIISWIILFKGVMLLAVPRSITSFEGWFTAKSLRLYILPMVIILGVIFGYYGFYG